MSAKPAIFWTAIAALGVLAAILMHPDELPVTSLDAGLGPEVVTEPL